MIHGMIGRVGRIAVLLAGVVGATACTSNRPFQITPVASNSNPILPDFPEGTYSYDRDGTVTILVRTHTKDVKTQQPIDEIATFRVFWRPVGGHTTLEKSALNATYRYIVMTPNSVGMYEGAGFVRLWGKNGKRHIDARVMDGDLRLTESSTNFTDTLGRCRLRGNLHARYDDAGTVDGMLKTQQEFFTRSLPKPVVTPAGVTATQPATFPAIPNDLNWMHPATQPTTSTQPGSSVAPATQSSSINPATSPAPGSPTP